MVISVIDELDVRIDRTRVGLIYWSNNAFVGFNMIDYGQVKQDVVEAIRRIPFLDDATHTAAALHLVHNTAFQRQNGDRDGVSNVAVVVSDGKSNVEAHLTPVEAATCRMNDIRLVVAVIYDEYTDITELSTVASRPLSQNLFTSSMHSLLNNITMAVVGSTCDGTHLLVSRHSIFVYILCYQK